MSRSFPFKSIVTQSTSHVSSTCAALLEMYEKVCKHLSQESRAVDAMCTMPWKHTYTEKIDLRNYFTPIKPQDYIEKVLAKRDKQDSYDITIPLTKLPVIVHKYTGKKKCVNGPPIQYITAICSFTPHQAY